ncbi:MAG: hypothetical protein JW957_06185 [Candidatus Omnitrophica bacterium]|nr:hypothetical protein [Candidatus Omnitrophota bacterium]
MTVRERFHAVMNFRLFDRLPVIEWAGWWGKTIDRWHTEGLPAELTDCYEICKYFGLDVYRQDWFEIMKKTCPGAIRNILYDQQLPGLVKNEKDYEQVKEHLFPDDAIDERVWEKRAKKQKSGEEVLWFSFDGFFWLPRKLLGVEKHLYAFYDQPELMHRINSDLAEWIIKTTERLCNICEPDFMTFGEDMSYNHGPMLSRNLFDAFMKPYYERVLPVMRKNNIISIVDSDGDVTIPALWFKDAGIDGILPLERQAGVDIAVLRDMYPDMRFIGQFDKMVMNKGEAAMRKEFERLLPTAAKGGFLISCDHQTPPGVSFNDYKLYVRLFMEYADIAGKISRSPSS